ncbi:MAG: DUF4349 domain-containing protein [Planctomycetes bacterium]|nr:DUF4349 domain-containing protein [Planctomycetota bacterium]
MDYEGFGGKSPGWGEDASRAGALSTDEQAVLDHVSGLTRVLPEPSDPHCQDREIVGELVAMRSRLGAMAIHPPKMRLTFDDILKAADNTPQPPTDNRVIYWITGRWGIGLVTAASVALAVLTGMLATGMVEPEADMAAVSSAARKPLQSEGIEFDRVTQVEQFPENKTRQVEPTSIDSEMPPGLYGSIVREGRLQLRGDDPADVQRRVTELVTSSGGMVTSLTRQGTGEDVSVEISVAVPADKYREFKTKVAGFGDVLHDSETTQDVTSDQVDLKARLSEAEDYLARLDKLIETPNDLSALQDLEHERRQTRLEIERYKRAIQSLENRTTLSRLDITVTTAAPAVAEPKGQFTKAWDDGLEGMGHVSAFLLKAGLAGSPFLALGAVAYLFLRRKRKKLEREDRLAA